MSLGIYLERTVHKSYDNKKTFIEEKEELYSDNITHNLSIMAKKADLYSVLWKPYELNPNYNIGEKDYKAQYKFEEENIVLAKELITTLEAGINLLESKPEYFKKFNPDNNWGNYKNLLNFSKSYLKACKQYPKAIVITSR